MLTGVRLTRHYDKEYQMNPIETLCTGDVVTLKSRVEVLFLMWKWDFDPIRVTEHPGNLEPASLKQLHFIAGLARKNKDVAFEMQSLLNAFSPDGLPVPLAMINKGMASYLIKVFKGEIKPKSWEIPSDWAPFLGTPDQIIASDHIIYDLDDVIERRKYFDENYIGEEKKAETEGLFYFGTRV